MTGQPRRPDAPRSSRRGGWPATRDFAGTLRNATLAQRVADSAGQGRAECSRSRAGIGSRRACSCSGEVCRPCCSEADAGNIRRFGTRPIRWHRRRALGASGRWIDNVLLGPGAIFTSIARPRSETMAYTSANPCPVPRPASLVVKNASKNYAALSSKNEQSAKK